MKHNREYCSAVYILVLFLPGCLPACLPACFYLMADQLGDAEAVFTDTGEIIDKLVYTYGPVSVPEPWALALLGSGMAFLRFARRRKPTE